MNTESRKIILIGKAAFSCISHDDLIQIRKRQ